MNRADLKALGKLLGLVALGATAIVFSVWAWWGLAQASMWMLHSVRGS